MKNLIIGYCYVVGDILHKGHREHLKNCKAMCDILVCGVLSEKAVLEKKPSPALPYHERFDAVRPYADVVVCQDEYSPLSNCKAMKPDILFESTSHKEQPANNYMKSIGSRVIALPYYGEQSSTLIKEKIRGKTNESK